MYKGLHRYIEELERDSELIRIRKFVDPVLEMAEIADRISKDENGGKAVLFENNGTGFPVLMNMMGSKKRMCKILGIEHYEDITQRINQLFTSIVSPKVALWDKLKLLPTLKQASEWFPAVSNKRGKCQEVIMKNPALSKLPILKCRPYDGGRFITLPMVHTKDPKTGFRNVGMYRMQVFSNTSTGMHWHKHKTGANHYQSFKDIHKDDKEVFPVAVALGGDPVYTFCATAPMPENIDEYLLAGFLRKKRVNLVKCITQPLEVPADVDFVIEGYIDPSALPVIEGPFGDHTGFYSLEDAYPLLHVTCITHRKNAVYPATVVGIPPQEDAYMSKAIEKIFLSPIRLTLAPEVIDLHMPVEGVTHNIVITKIKNRYPGQAIKVAHALWGAGQMMFNKIMIIVDDDIDITDYPAVIKVITEHYSPEHDTYFSHGPLDVLDHTAQTNGFGGKICIDATRKAKNEGQRAKNVQTIKSTDPFTIYHSPFTILFDDCVDTADIATCMWLMGNNVDPVRDCKVENGQLIVDARSKLAKNKEEAKETCYPIRWPNIVCADDKTIERVNTKWASFHIGKLILSPSLKYKQLVKPGGAEVKYGN